MIVPIVATGPLSESTHFQTTLRFLPLTSGAIAFFDIKGTDNNGGPLNVACDFTPISAVGQSPGGPKYRICGPSPRFANQTIDGWLKVTTPAGVKISAEISLLENGQPLTRFTVPAAVPSRNFRALVFDGTDFEINRQTAFSLVNSSTTQFATVELAVLDSSGKTLLSNNQAPISMRIRIPPLNRISKFLFEFLTEGPSPPVKSLNEFLAIRERLAILSITSDIPIAAAGLDMVPSAAGVQFINIPLEATG